MTGTAFELCSPTYNKIRIKSLSYGATVAGASNGTDHARAAIALVTNQAQRTRMGRVQTEEALHVDCTNK